MYAKNSNNVRFFKDSKNQNTEKVVFGRVSEAVRSGKKDEKGNDIWVYENWNARFVGKAYEKAKVLEDKASITLTEWAVRCPYVEEKKKSYPYIMVMDFDVRERGNNSPAPESADNGDGFMNIPDGIDEELPFPT